MPSEVEWEYAARGGLDQCRYPWGDELTRSDLHERSRAASLAGHGDDGFVGAAPVDAFPPNGYGLYNATGNVWSGPPTGSAPAGPGAADDSRRLLPLP